MKKIRNLIIILFIFIILISLVLLLINNNKEKENAIIGDAGKTIDYENSKIEKVSQKTDLMIVNNCINLYYSYLNKNNSIYYTQTDNGLEIKDSEDINSIILTLLSKKYINEKGITKDNLQEKISLVEKKIVFVPLKMNLLQKENMEKYISYGILTDSQYTYIDDVYIIVNIDKNNQTFSIEPVDKKVNSIEEINIQNENDPIEYNQYNKYVKTKVGTEDIIKFYFDTYKRLMLSNSKIAYEFLEEQYREIRFDGEGEFTNYIQSNIDDIKKRQLKEYSVNTYSEYIEYICKDQYENYYIFKETAPMEFTLTLDTYTIESETFKQEYEQANEQTKVLMNIDKWIDMLNNRDYKTAYSVLDETFRNNNFGSEEKFEEYMREKFPGHYKLNYGNYEKQGQNNVQEVVLTQIVEDEVGSVSTSVVMKLLEGTNFVMSFNII